MAKKSSSSEASRASDEPSTTAAVSEPANAPAPSSPPRLEQARDAPRAVDFRPSPSIHLAQAGECVLSNWIGRVKGHRVRVFRGARVSEIPPSVLSAVKASGVATGAITLQSLGLVRTAGAGPQVISREPGTLTPGANLLGD